MDEKKEFFVQSEDRRRFRMCIRGDLGKLSVAMIRKNLRPYGVPEGQDLYAQGQRLDDHMLGREFGLVEGAVLQLVPPRGAPPVSVSAASRNALYSAAANTTGAASTSPPASAGELSGPPVLQSTASPRDAALRDENQQMREEIQFLRKELHLLEMGSTSRKPASPRVGSGDLQQVAAESLRLLGEALGVRLQLGQELSCSIGTAETTIFISLDPPTERLYIYASLLTSLPQDPSLRLKLYEVLLQGSLLSREVCGGGIGLSLETEVVLLSTSLPMLHTAPQALSEVMPVFVTALSRWRHLLDELLSS